MPDHCKSLLVSSNSTEGAGKLRFFCFGGEEWMRAESPATAMKSATTVHSEVESGIGGVGAVESCIINTGVRFTLLYGIWGSMCHLLALCFPASWLPCTCPAMMSSHDGLYNVRRWYLNSSASRISLHHLTLSTSIRSIPFSHDATDADFATAKQGQARGIYSNSISPKILKLNA